MPDIFENIINIKPKIFSLREKNLSKFISLFTPDYKIIFYFSNPDSDFEVLAAGKIFSIQTDYSGLKDVIAKLNTKIEELNIHEEIKNLPLFFGYCKFPSLIKENTWIDFEDAEWILPEFIIYSDKKNSILINFSVKTDYIIDEISSYSKDDFQNHKKDFNIRRFDSNIFSDWEKKVKSAVEMIEQKKLKKIVLSRKKEYEFDDSTDLVNIIDKLNEFYPNCLNFLIKSESSHFFGSSPELLAEINQSEFRTEALAGSVERGNSDNEDIKLTVFLLSDSKNLQEHQLVIDYLKSNLEDVICNFSTSDKPKIKKFRNIQHLNTEITGQIKSDIDIFNIISKIFPTPAVCGIPKDTAIKVLSELEGFERGIFTGIIGWFNLDNQAKFYVAIRSGLLKGNHLTLFAGCGIVQSSDALDEFKETEIKIKAISDLFNVEN